MVKVTLDQLVVRFEQYADDVLLDRWTSNDLTDVAREAIASVLESRGIAPSVAAGEAEEPEHSGPVDTPYETIARFGTSPEAQILCSRLKAEGIRAIVTDEHLVTANWFLSNALGGIRVQVPRCNVDTARNIIGQIERGDLDLDNTAADT